MCSGMLGLQCFHDFEFDDGFSIVLEIKVISFWGRLWCPTCMLRGQQALYCFEGRHSDIAELLSATMKGLKVPQKTSPKANHDKPSPVDTHRLTMH